MTMDEQSDFPERLTVEISSSCNLQCVMCPRQIVEGMAGMMDIDLYRKVIKESREHLPVTLVPFFRGESLLHPHFLEMMKMAKEADLGPIQLTTNAMLLDKKVAEELVAMGIDFISFSLDVLGKEAYEATRIGGEYERVVRNVERFLDIRAARHSSLPEVQISAVETEENRAMMAAFTDYWGERADRVRVYPEHSSDGVLGSIRGGKHLPSFEKRLPCRKVFTDMVICWNGDVAICNHDWDRREYIGNIGDTTIGEIWRGEKYREIRQRHNDGELENDPTCSGCDHWKMYYIPEGMIGRLYSRVQV